MRGFVWVRADRAEGEALQAWIELAARYVGAFVERLLNEGENSEEICFFDLRV